MKRFAPDQLTRFFVALDGHLDGPAEITIIGGSALALGYDVERATNDIDTFESDLERAVREPRHRSGAMALP